MLSYKTRLVELAGDPIVWASGLLFASVAIMSSAYGFQHKAHGSILNYFLLYSIFFFTVVCLLGWTLLRKSTATGVSAGEDARVRIGVAFGFASAALTAFFYSEHLPLHWLALVVPTGIVLLVLVVANRLAVAAVFGLAAGISQIIFLVIVIPMDPAGANMLPAVQAACGDIAAGISPYGNVYPGITSVPLYYLPALILPYCPLAEWGLDLRLLNLGIMLALIIGLSFAFRLWKSPAAFALGITPLIVSPPVAQMAVHGHIWTYWAAIVVSAMALVGGRRMLLAVAFGIALATRQMAVFIALPLAIYLSRQLGVRVALAYGGLAVLVYLAAVAPAIVQVTDFIGVFYLKIAVSVGAIHNQGGNPFDQIALSSLLIRHGWPDALTYVQLVIVLGTSAFVLRRSLQPWQFLVVAGVSYIFIIGCNAFLSRYLYMPGLILVALAIACRVRSLEQQQGGATVQRRESSSG